MKKLINYIERGSWEEDLESAEEWLDGLCLAVIALAVVVFGPAILHVLVEAVSR
ncbi:MAG: hypothetical protein ACYDG4_16640 [Desulfuromonadaceae bacterium]